MGLENARSLATACGDSRPRQGHVISSWEVQLFEIASLYFLLQIQIFRFRGTDENALSLELIFSSSGWSVSLLKAVSLNGCFGISRDQDQLPN